MKQTMQKTKRKFEKWWKIRRVKNKLDCLEFERHVIGIRPEFYYLEKKELEDELEKLENERA